MTSATNPCPHEVGDGHCLDCGYGPCCDPRVSDADVYEHEYENGYDDYDLWYDVADEYYDTLYDMTCPWCYEEYELCSCLDIDYGDHHADRRDEQRARDVLGMRVTNRSIKSVILPVLARQRNPRRTRETIRRG